MSPLYGTHAPKKIQLRRLLGPKWRCVTLPECRSVRFTGPMSPRKSTSDGFWGASAVESVIGDPFPQENPAQTAPGAQVAVCDAPRVPWSQLSGAAECLSVGCRGPMAPRKSSSDGFLGARMGGVRIASGLQSVAGDPWPQENPTQTGFWGPEWRASGSEAGFSQL